MLSEAGLAPSVATMPLAEGRGPYSCQSQEGGEEGRGEEQGRDRRENERES
jgi:hypothetical protein